MKKKTIGVKKIRALLSESVFNPNEPGPLKIIADTANPDYFVLRAIELIQESRFHAQENRIQTADEKIKQAISLLILTRATRNVTTP